MSRLPGQPSTLTPVTVSSQQTPVATRRITMRGSSADVVKGAGTGFLMGVAMSLGQRSAGVALGLMAANSLAGGLIARYLGRSETVVEDVLVYRVP